MTLTFAIAVTAGGTLENQHFGEAARFLRFEVEDSRLQPAGEIDNPFQHHHGHHQGNGQAHGHGQKAGSIIGLLQDEGVHILVSRQYGPNIRKVCRHFVPVLVSDPLVETVVGKIEQHLQEIAVEWAEHTDKHHVLRIMEDRVLSIAVKD